MESDANDDNRVLVTESRPPSEPSEVISFLLSSDPADPNSFKEEVDNNGTECPSLTLTADIKDSDAQVLDVDPGADQDGSVPIQMTAVSLADGTTTLVTSQGQALHLEDGTAAYLRQSLEDKEMVQDSGQGNVSDGGGDLSPKFIDGQAIQLEDGTTAFIHTAPKEGLQAVQLEDGTTAYIASGLSGLDPFEEEDGGSGSDNRAPTRFEVQPSSSAPAPTRLSAKALALGDKAFACTYEGCGRLYTTQHHLKVHERSHTGDRPFRCEVDGCGRAFATGYGLKSHTRVHTGEKPYKCVEEYCDKAFKTSGDLQKHVRTHTGERPFKCPFEGCDRSFTTSNIRKVHVRTHTGERPYTCPEEGCGRSFASATNYKNHIRIHTGEKPYVCTVRGCGKRFTEYSSLYKHHVVHTHTKPYVCSLCGKNYRQTSTLAMHTRTAHGIVDPACAGEDPDEAHAQELAAEDEEEEEDSDTESVAENAECPTKKRPRIQVMVAGSDMNDPATLVALQAAQQAAEQAIQQVHQQQAQMQLAAARGMPQILVVTDTGQFTALQQLDQQQLALANAGEAATVSEESTATGDDGPIVAYSVSI